MYDKFPVELPEAKGKLVIKKQGRFSYVLFEYDRDYIPEKNYTIPKRAIIGKLTLEDPTLMYPNEKYRKYFPETPVLEDLPRARRSVTLRIGAYIVIKKILQEYHLPEMLGRQLGENLGLFFDFVSNMIISEDTDAQHYPYYAFCHPLFSEGMRIYGDSKTGRMLSSVTKNKMQMFMDDWNRGRDHSQRIYLSCDAADTRFQAGDVELAAFGETEDKTEPPTYNLAVAYDQSNQVPLFYEEYPGSIADLSQLSCMTDEAEAYHYKNVGFILSRGYFTRLNIQYMDKNNCPFIIMAEGQKALVSDLVDKHRTTFETDQDCSIQTYKVYGKTVKSPLYDGDSRDRYFHLYFSPFKQAAERELLEQTIDRQRQFLEKHLGQKVSFGKTYQEYFTLAYDEQETFLSAAEKNDVIQQQLERCGYFCIITSENMTAAEALTLYTGQDMSWDVFRMDALSPVPDRMSSYSEETLSGKVFAAFIALIVRNRICNLLKETAIRTGIGASGMTVPEALLELEKIEIGRIGNSSYRLDHAVTKKQREILSAFGISEKDVRTSALEISKSLTDDPLLYAAQSQEEENNGKDKF